MANDFKRFTVSSASTSTGASGSALYSCPAGAGSSALESIIIGITLANKTTTGVTADIYLDGYDGTDTYIVKSATIPAGSALECLANLRPCCTRAYHRLAGPAGRPAGPGRLQQAVGHQS